MKLTKLAIVAQIPDNGIKTMADKGVRIVFDTQEPTPEQFKDIFTMKGKAGKLVFVSEEAKITPEDLEIPDVKPEFANEKTPSQRLRAVLYRLWEQGNGTMAFEVFYRAKMETIINQLKDKLD